MEDANKHTDLEAENQRLQERIAWLEQELKVRRTTKFRVLRLFVQTYATKPLYSSISKLVEELADRKIQRDTIRDVLYATLRRLTRVGFITLLIALAPLSMAVLQTYYLKKQNEKFDVQNKRIEQQTYLQEAERRSSLVFLFDNVLDKIDDELLLNPTRRELSAQLVGRIVALSKALKPYRYLEGDTITGQMSSPERGQLLLSLVASKLHPGTLDQIYLLADFSYATLENVNLDGAYLRNINLTNAFLDKISLTGADLRNANLERAHLSGAQVRLTGLRASPAHFDFANFHDTEVLDSDLSGSSFEYANFTGARLHNVTFRRAFFSQAKFAQVVADSLDFSEALFLNTAFTLQDHPSKRSKNVFQFAGVRLDTASYRQIAALPLTSAPLLDTSRREFRINRDTFYLDDKSKPVVVADSVEIFGTK